MLCKNIIFFFCERSSSYDCSGVAQHALILGPSDHVRSDSTKSVLAQPVNTALQSDPSQKSVEPKSPCMGPRTISIIDKKQGFSEAVAARIEAPQRGSARSVYGKVDYFYKWCVTNQVDLRAPPVKSVADFLMYLLQTGSYSPAPLMVTSARTKISLVSWIVSTETNPKAGEAYPPGTSHWSCTS